MAAPRCAGARKNLASAAAAAAFYSGAPDDRWDNNALVSELRQVHGQNFEVVRMDGRVTG